MGKIVDLANYFDLADEIKLEEFAELLSPSFQSIH